MSLIKEQIKQRVNCKISNEANTAQRSQELGAALKLREKNNISNKLTSDQYRIDCLNKIVENEQNRVKTRLDVVREKSKILTRLIKDEEFNGTNDNSVIGRGVWNLLHN